MDIDLLSKMVKDLILDKDEVNLPGVGCFVAEMVPSTFSDKGYTINPPYRKLSFRNRTDVEDNSLVEMYARSNNLAMADAEKILKAFLAEMREVLQEKKNIIFPGLGRLRATRENNFFFVADEELDIYPGGFALESLSLKSHKETAESFSAAVEGIKEIMAQPVGKASVAEPAAEPVKEPENGPAVEAKPEAVEAAAVEMETIGTAAVEAAAEAEAVGPEPAGTEEVEAKAETEPETGLVVEEETETTGADAVEAAAAEAVEANVGTKAENVEADAAETKPETEPEVKPTIETEPAGKDRAKATKRHTAAIVPAACIGALILFFALYIILSRVAPDFMDRLLYSKEELEILKMMR